MKYLLILGLLFSIVVNSPAQKKSKRDEVVTISTDFGDIVVILYDKTPQHKKNFIKLAKEGFYNETTFHRIIDGFMIQGGDPFSKDSIEGNEGRGGPPYNIPAEFDPALKHKYGALAAARMGDHMNPQKESNGSQFYIVENKEGAHFLNQNYTVFGEVIQGMDVVEKIAEQPKAYSDKPLKDIRMKMTVRKMKKSVIEKKYNGNFYE